MRLGERSKQRLATCHPILQEVVEVAARNFPGDFTVLCGERTREEQEKAVAAGFSKVGWPGSKHNRRHIDHLGVRAVDLAPWHADKPNIRWDRPGEFKFLAGWVMAVAAERDIKMRWGGDWDMDGDQFDQRFIDLPHFELTYPDEFYRTGTY